MSMAARFGKNLSENSSEPQPTPLPAPPHPILGAHLPKTIHQHFLAVFKNVQNLCRPFKKCLVQNGIFLTNGL